jgi:hypothetical protein
VESAEYTILVLNLAFALGFGLPLAGRFARLAGKESGRMREFALLLSAYLLESVAFAASMATNVLSVALAFVWGPVLANWFQRGGHEIDAVKGVVQRFAVYSSLPAVSLMCVPPAAALGGWSIVSVYDGARFGIPDFLFFPLNTILGFCFAVALSAAVCKVVITTATATWLLRRRQAVS